MTKREEQIAYILKKNNSVSAKELQKLSDSEIAMLKVKTQMRTDNHSSESFHKGHTLRVKVKRKSFNGR